MSANADPRRGDIWLVEFDPSVGTEIRKTRPAVVVSNDMANSRTSKVTVLPITSTIRHIPIVVVVPPDAQNGLDRQSLIRVPDVSTFDKVRLKRRLGSLRADQMEDVNDKLRTHLSL